jgi:TrmH family RNA methyltransferase
VKLLSLARDLGRRKARERRAMFVVEGVRATEELLRSNLVLTGALIAPQLDEAPRGRALHDALIARGLAVEEVTPRDFASAAQTESPQGILAVAEVPDRSLEHIIAAAAPILVLDGLQDPGNVGTILRTAAALGASATLALPGTVDLWNPKVVRSAVGAHFTHLAFDTTWETLSAFLSGNAIELWVAAANGTSVRDIRRPSRVAIALGNEGAGVSSVVAEAASQRISIPINAQAESLNVAIAAGILLFALSDA